MHVIVLGAGLAGVTSAWYLRQAGHEVTVIDRQPGPALETSFANGGQLSASHPEPWANPGTPAQVLRWLGKPDAPLVFRPRADWHQWAWALRFLVECLPHRTRRNTVAIAQLALYSRNMLAQLRAETDIAYEAKRKGILHLFFEPRDFAAAGKRAELLLDFGMPAEVLDPRRCVVVEPALEDSGLALLGGLYAPADESGDAYLFTHALAARCAEIGVTFRFDTRVETLQRHGGRIAAATLLDGKGRSERVIGDAYLIALGSHSPLLLRPLDIALPIYPVKGYSITIPLAAGSSAPEVSITDESRRMVYARLGDRLRVAGTAELAGYDNVVDAGRCDAILRRARQLFPRLEAAGEIEYWAGLRPTTPSNVPIIGRTRYENLYCNTGHGTLGWTLACGSARCIADIMNGSAPPIDFPFSGASVHYGQ